MMLTQRKVVSFIEWLTKRKKPLSRMTRSELRRQELLLEKDRNQLLRKVEKISKDNIAPAVVFE